MNCRVELLNTSWEKPSLATHYKQMTWLWQLRVTVKGWGKLPQHLRHPFVLNIACVENHYFLWQLKNAATSSYLSHEYLSFFGKAMRHSEQTLPGSASLKSYDKSHWKSWFWSLASRASCAFWVSVQVVASQSPFPSLAFCLKFTSI